MNSIDLIKTAAVDSTNKLLYEHGLPPVLNDKFSLSNYQQRLMDAGNRTLSNGQAEMRAYQQNAGEHANAWKLLEDIGRKAAMLDELLPSIKAYINADRYTVEHNRARNDVIHLIQRAGDLK